MGAARSPQGVCNWCSKFIKVTPPERGMRLSRRPPGLRERPFQGPPEAFQGPTEELLWLRDTCNSGREKPCQSPPDAFLSSSGGAFLAPRHLQFGCFRLPHASARSLPGTPQRARLGSARSPPGIRQKSARSPPGTHQAGNSSLKNCVSIRLEPERANYNDRSTCLIKAWIHSFSMSDRWSPPYTWQPQFDTNPTQIDTNPTQIRHKSARVRHKSTQIRHKSDTRRYTSDTHRPQPREHWRRA